MTPLGKVVTVSAPSHANLGHFAVSTTRAPYKLVQVAFHGLCKSNYVNETHSKNHLPP
jgi:hypothetical protein